MRIVGTVVRFDEVRGYGFISPDQGGDDIFLHANDLSFDKSLIKPGVKVEFGIETGSRGQFATRVEKVDRVSSKSASAATADGSEELSDVLSTREFMHEVTEIMLRSAPGLTAEHIVKIRRELTSAAQQHGWIEND